MSGGRWLNDTIKNEVEMTYPAFYEDIEEIQGCMSGGKVFMSTLWVKQKQKQNDASGKTDSFL